MQYPKNELPNTSEFIKNNLYKDDNSVEWKRPILEKSFTVNGIEWNKYETNNKEAVYRGELQNLYVELKPQGEVNFKLMRDFLSTFKQSDN